MRDVAGGVAVGLGQSRDRGLDDAGRAMLGGVPQGTPKRSRAAHFEFIVEPGRT
jgi:hypothetical protein